MIRYDVVGDPQPQGSKTAVVRGSRAVLLDGRRGPARAAFASWRKAVAEASAQHPADLDEPVLVVLSFRLLKPRSLPRWRWLHSARFDIDKLARAVLDSMTEGGTLRDDGRVAALVATKRLVLERPGVSITVHALGELERRLGAAGAPGGGEPLYLIPWPGPASAPAVPA